MGAGSQRRQAVPHCHHDVRPEQHRENEHAARSGADAGSHGHRTAVRGSFSRPQRRAAEQLLSVDRDVLAQGLQGPAGQDEDESRPDQPGVRHGTEHGRRQSVGAAGDDRSASRLARQGGVPWLPSRPAQSGPAHPGEQGTDHRELSGGRDAREGEGHHRGQREPRWVAEDAALPRPLAPLRQVSAAVRLPAAPAAAAQARPRLPRRRRTFSSPKS